MVPLLIAGTTLAQADGLRDYGGPDVYRSKEKLSAISAAGDSGIAPRILVVGSELLDANYETGLSEFVKRDGLLVLVVLNALADDGFRFILAGCAGVLRPDVSVQELLHLLPRVAAGEIWGSPMLLSRALRQLLRTEGQSGLTAREQQVFELVSTGMTNREIAEELCVARETVRWHMRSINTKLGKATVGLLRRRKQISPRDDKSQNLALGTGTSLG